MAREFGLSVTKIGAVFMLTQIGMATGMLVFVPLGDKYERRALISTLLVAASIALAFMAIAPTVLWLSVASFAVGATQAWGWTPFQRGFAAPPRWVRTARNARIGSSTSIIGTEVSTAVRLMCGPTIAAEAGEVRSILAYRSFSMKVMSPGLASPTGRAE